MALPPHWMDGVIDDVPRGNNVRAIARAIAYSERFLDAIERGLMNFREQPKGAIGPTRAQYIRQAVIEALTAESAPGG